MKLITLIIVATGIIGLACISKSKTVDKKNTVKTVNGSFAPVAVLELFTSEGCSSCPSADRLLPQLSKLDANVIPLSFHVDYWNRLGWKDPFSSAEFTNRQQNYSNQFRLESVYTPQLVVNGEYEMVGSSRNNAESSIRKALKEKAAVNISIANVTTDGDKLSFSVKADGEIKQTDLLAALVQKQAVVNVRAGENGGTKLTHTNVVRVFEKEKAESAKDFKITIPKDLMDNNWELIVYAQQKSNLKITGASLYNPAAK